MGGSARQDRRHIRETRRQEAGFQVATYLILACHNEFVNGNLEFRLVAWKVLTMVGAWDRHFLPGSFWGGPAPFIREIPNHFLGVVGFVELAFFFTSGIYA